MLDEYPEQPEAPGAGDALVGLDAGVDPLVLLEVGAVNECPEEQKSL